MGRAGSRPPGSSFHGTPMSRILRFLLLSLVLVIAGCGDDDSSSETPAGTSTSAAAETPASDAGAEATTSSGVTAQQFGAIQLRSQRATVRKRLGAPATTSKPDAATECLDYPAVDDAGKPVQGLVYRFCFDQSDQLTIRTTISTAP